MSVDPQGIWDDIRFLVQVVEDSKRTIVCSPDLESRIKGFIDAHGMAGVYKVMTNPWVPDDKIFVVDENAMEASWRQTMQTWKPTL